MELFLKMCGEMPFYKELERAVRGSFTPCALTGVSNIHKAQLCGALSALEKVLVICDDESACTRLVDDINALFGENSAALFPARDLNFAYMEGISREYEHKRIETLSRIMSGGCRIAAASVESVMQGTIPPETLRKYSFELCSGAQVDTTELARSLVEAGYSRTEQVEGQAQFAIRGSIVDIFPVQESRPVRIELWGDEIDTVSYFDTQSQRRSDPIDRITVSPALEILFLQNELEDKLTKLYSSVKGRSAEKIKEHISKDIDRVQSGIALTNSDKYYTLAYDRTYTLFDYFQGGICVFSEYQNCCERAKDVLAKEREDLKLMYDDGVLFKRLEGFCTDFTAVKVSAEKMQSVYMDTFMRSHNDVKFKKLINADCRQTGVWGGNIIHLAEELKGFSEQGYCTAVLAGSEKTLPIIAKDLAEQGLDARIMTEQSEILPGVVWLTTGSLSGGFDYPDIKCAAITQMKAMTAKKKFKKKHRRGEEISSLADISPGDLVVHSMYGIGRFAGIRNLETNGVTKDYISIKYAGTDVLYVPVTQLDLVSRYVGPSDETSVRLNKLNSAEWNKTRSRVRSAVKDMAQELIKLYAQRQTAEGYAFSPDNDWQRDFEERFDYQETDDQLRSVREIKEDMQKPVPMDRLLCGDVGFGKTEVALRAAFKCMLDSKQAAILVPTTVLAWQHYQTAVKRFEHFPIKVELLSRFRTPAQQQQIIREIKRGTVDLVIGTHRLVQKDVQFKDLGLVIVDEEQRFGVAHKEKFKENFHGVDVLTLSATPIPRTLNMALSGIRDMSVIEEPPQDRQPIQTYVIEHDDGVVIQAINKELRRGGQVYYIHNRVETIERTALNLQEKLPQARIGVAHGQMAENQLSEIWRQLIDREIDILVCTTIIETGVDVPNVNTLIIEDADRLGLSQLYQLRGRVGRSSRRAFAYFTFRRGKVLTEVASKRLNAIKEFTQFGSGFHIALRDLEIRGAGSVLSGRQHGHMEAVGYDMYLRLLNEAIAEQKGESVPRSSEDCLVDISIDAYIPEEYIESLPQRIDAYRKIASVVTEEDGRDVTDELIDRFGDPPKSVVGLINVALIRNMASQLGITEIAQRGENVFFCAASPEVEQIQALSEKYGSRLRFTDGAKPGFSVRLENKQKAAELMAETVKLMSAVREKR